MYTMQYILYKMENGEETPIKIAYTLSAIKRYIKEKSKETNNIYKLEMYEREEKVYGEGEVFEEKKEEIVLLNTVKIENNETIVLYTKEDEILQQYNRMLKQKQEIEKMNDMSS